jgi:hypothetical protein
MNFQATLGLTLAMLIAPLAAASAQNAPPEEEVVVTGEGLREQAQAFVNTITSGPQGRVAIWDRLICPGIVGVSARHAQYILDRVAERAAEVGLGVREPGCTANLQIYIAADPESVARRMVDIDPLQFGYDTAPDMGDPELETMGRAALREFIETPRPVRWWHLSQSVTTDGFSAHGNGRRPFASRLVGAAHLEMSTAVIIVDARSIAHLPIGALADYLALVSLAQLDPDADTTSYETILNVFANQAAGRATPTALTDWDIAYLHGLYGASDQPMTNNLRRNAIAEEMTHTAEGQ